MTAMLLCCAFGAGWGMATARAMSAAPVFTLDYAAAPGARWHGALALATQGRSWGDSWGPVFAFHDAALFDKLERYTDLAGLGRALDAHFPAQALELRGIAAQFGALFPEQAEGRITYEYLAAWVYYHELAHTNVAGEGGSIDSAYAAAVSRECTGLLAMDKEEHVVHVANMDQSPPNVRNVTLHVRFVNSAAGTDALFEGVDWYWFTTGTSRMVAKNVASFQENWRASSPPLPLERVMAAIADGAPPQIFVFRSLLEEVTAARSGGGSGSGTGGSSSRGSRSSRRSNATFEALVDRMSTIRLAAPYYVVMAGPGKRQGAIIARSTAGLAGGGVLRFSKNGTLSSWALVQTNYDHWKPDASDDPRRTVAETTLKNMGRGGSLELTLFSVASTFPVHNPHTAYTAVFDIRAGTLRAFVRTGLCPVDPASTFSNERYDAYCSSSKGGGGGGGGPKKGDGHGDKMLHVVGILVLAAGACMLAASIVVFMCANRKRAGKTRRKSQDDEVLLLNHQGI